MAGLIRDDIDFAAYEVETEFAAKVRPASIFADDLEAEFTPRIGVRSPVMQSTKLRHAIEFRPGEVTVWAGYNGHRKSTFTGQVALDLIAADERALLVSLEMPPSKTLARMVKQACASDSPGPKQRRAFMSWTDGRLWLFDHVGRLTPSKCLAVCRYFVDQHEGRHVFVDSFMKVCESEESMDEQKKLIGDVCNLAKETGLHMHLVAHCRKPTGGAEDKPPTKYDIKGSGAISDQAHNIILVYEDKPKRAEADRKEPRPEVMARPDAIITIDKQRNGSVEGKFGLWIDHRSLRFCDNALEAVQPYDMREAA
jgi:twinkle protein